MVTVFTIDISDVRMLLPLGWCHCERSWSTSFTSNKEPNIPPGKAVTKYCDKVLKEKLSSFFLTLGDFILLQMSFCPFFWTPISQCPCSEWILLGEIFSCASFLTSLNLAFFTVFREIIFTKWDDYQELIKIAKISGLESCLGLAPLLIPK